MNPDNQKKITDQINSLPKEIQNIILAGDWKQWVGNIVKKNTLNLDQASSLEAEIFIFLIGLAGIFDLRKSIEVELRVPVSKVNDIMIDINDMIVDPLKQKLIDSTDGEDEFVTPTSLPIIKHIALEKKQEEILDRQTVLNDIEEARHAEGVGVYIPEHSQPERLVEKKLIHINQVQPIVQNAQVNSAKANPMLANVIPVAKPAVLVQKAPENIFEAKTQGLVVPASTRSVGGGTDIYREPVI
jgi:hypothetical protein